MRREHDPDDKQVGGAPVVVRVKALCQVDLQVNPAYEIDCPDFEKYFVS